MIIDEDTYGVTPLAAKDFEIIHGVEMPQDRLARGQVLRFTNTAIMETMYCDFKLKWSHNPKVVYYNMF